MKLVTHDINPLIGLHSAGLAEAWINSGVQIHTTNLAIHDVINEADILQRAGALHVVPMPPQELLNLLSFHKIHKKLSLEDCAIFRLAYTLQVPLLTAERDLREAAEKSGIKVHGVLWILDNLIEQQFITPAQAIEAMRARGNCFAKEEFKIRMRLWSKPLK